VTLDILSGVCIFYVTSDENNIKGKTWLPVGN